jgi:tRNA A-37 threonylcarbamoyl transferase component Bud32
MTYFKAALSAPALHFKRLRLAEPILCNGEPIVRRTHSAIETEIIWEGRRFLLYLPFHRQSILHIEQFEEMAQERCRGPLIENLILHEELTLRDSIGQKHNFDVVLQEFPYGLMLRDAVMRYNADDVIVAIQKMKSRMDSIGFCHNNLNPSNLIICKDGSAHPLRYWYAKWEDFSDNDISQLLDFIESHRHDECKEALPHLLTQDYEAEYVTKRSKYDGITRLCRGSRYGFVDSDGSQITPFIYSWASELREDRAVVAKNGKMGAIDSNGRKVIPVIYKSVEFDIETGIFTATRNTYRYLIDYEGKIIRRTEIETEEPIQIEVEA